MLVVKVVYRDKAAHLEVLRRLGVGLQEIVVRALSTTSAKLNKDDIDLIFEKGKGINTGKDLKIIVFANDFPEIVASVQERSDQISEEIKELLSPSPHQHGEPIHGFVYVRLAPAGLGTF